MIKIDILVNNAGVITDGLILTKDGIEQTLQANHLSPMLLTFLLLDKITNTDNGYGGRIINLASTMHNMTDLKTMEVLMTTVNYKDVITGFKSCWTQYASSKLANVLFTNHLMKVLESKFKYIKTASVHPGGVNTEFNRWINDYNIIIKIIFYMVYPIVWFCMKTSYMGAQTTLQLCYEDLNKIENGQYYENCRRSTQSELARNTGFEMTFMKYSWKMIKDSIKGKFEVSGFVHFNY